MTAVLPALLCVLTLGGAAGVLGLPLALAIRRTTQGVLPTLFDAIVLGVAMAGLLLILFATFRLPGVTVGGLALIALCWALAARRGLPAANWWAPRRLGPWSVATGVVLIFGTIARLRTTNELPWIGDMGGYLNWANQFAQTGELSARWPPLLPALLAVPARLFGIEFTASLVPLFGILVLTGLARVAGQLGLPEPARFVVVAVAAASPHLLWFSTFPASEGLQAALLLALVTVTALGLPSLRSEAGPQLPSGLAIGLATAVLTTAMTVNRGQTLGLVLPVLLVAAVLVGRPMMARQDVLRWWTAGALLGIGAGHVYGVVAIRRYWIRIQLESLVPETVLDIARAVGLLRGATAAVGVIVLTGLVVGVLWMVQRRTRGDGEQVDPGRSTGTDRRLTVACTAVGITGVAVVLAAGTGEVNAALLRIGWLLPVLAVVALLMPAARAGERGAPVLLLGAIAVLFVVVHVLRFEAEEVHTVYLYWDRYLTSEYLPTVLVLAAVGVVGLGQVLRHRVRLQQAWAVVGGALAVGLVISWIPRIQAQYGDEAFGGLFAFVDDIASRTDGGDPVVWTADAPGDVPGMFPNSVWSFGAPLKYSYGRDVVALRPYTDGFLSDPLADRSDVVNAAACSPTRAASVIEWRRDPGADPIAVRLEESDLTWTDRGSVTVTTRLLGQHAQIEYHQQTLVADVYHVRVAPGTECRAID